MTNLRTIAAAIDAAFAAGITGSRAIRLLAAIRDEINDQEQLDDLEADAEFHSARSHTGRVEP